ncbi:MAG: DUF3631 domain-containing protein [Nitrospinae bacterium]|nr:DUF3631 domain-containing protein [Nitrospinota bacterium]
MKLAHGEIVKRLEDIGVKGAAKVVSSAFKPPVGEASKARGSKPVLFEDVEPWPEPADGAGLLDEITAILKRFVIMPEMANVANSLWILHAWAIDSFQVSPLLRIESPAKGCGKSTLLMVNGELLPRNLSTANITTASLFRLVDSHGVSLCIDETDTSFRENQDLIGLVNAGYLGYLKKTAIAPRCDGDSHEVKLFSSWCPKVLAGIGRLSDTTESRCIRIRLERKLPGEKTEPFSLCKTEIFAPIKEKLARWSADNLGALAEATPDIPKGLGDRAADNWRPLLAVADLAGGPWPEQARKAALELSGNDAQDDDSPGMALFEDIKEFFEHGHTDTVSSETLVNHLVGLESRPWAEWRQGKPISKNGLARLLKKFGIGPRQFKENGDKTRGYFLDDFWEVFSRYLQAPGNPTGTTGTVRESKDLSGFSNGTEKKLVPDGNNDNLFENRRVPVVPDGIPGMSEKKEIGGLFEAEEFQV